VEHPIAIQGKNCPRQMNMLAWSREQVIAISKNKTIFVKELCVNMRWDTRNAEFFRFPTQEISRYPFCKIDSNWYHYCVL
jgi:hypothetical protein